MHCPARYELIKREKWQFQNDSGHSQEPINVYVEDFDRGRGASKPESESESESNSESESEVERDQERAREIERKWWKRRGVKTKKLE